MIAADLQPLQAGLFADLPQDMLVRIAALGERQHLRRGEVLFHEGDAAQQLYLVLQGRMRSFCRVENGREFVFSIDGPGTSYGELALLLDEPRQASVAAEEPAQLLAITRQAFLGLLDQQPDLKQHILFAALREVQRLSQMVKNLALRDVYGRLKLLLEGEAQPDSAGVLRIDALTQQAMADRVGASREMIAKILKQLVLGGYVKLERRQVILTQRLPDNF